MLSFLKLKLLNWWFHSIRQCIAPCHQEKISNSSVTCTLWGKSYGSLPWENIETIQRLASTAEDFPDSNSQWNAMLALGGLGFVWRQIPLVPSCHASSHSQGSVTVAAWGQDARGANGYEESWGDFGGQAHAMFFVPHVCLYYLHWTARSS